MGRRRRRDGFSLLEVLVALMILSVASVLILGRMQAITDYHLRLQGHLRDINDLMTDVALFPTRKTEEDGVRLVGEHLEIRQPGQQEPVARVSNFSLQAYQVPISLGYSPYQVYTLSSDKGRALNLVMPGLLPRAGQ